MANLPYVTASGNVARALNAIAAAATPDNVSQNFVKTILKIPGGSGDQMTSFLKKVGFANSDGTPTDVYRKFRNSATRGTAAAESLRFGYAPLYKRNEFMHELADKDLKGLILEETGAAADSTAPNLVFACIKSLKQFANFKTTTEAEVQADFVPFPSEVSVNLDRPRGDQSQGTTSGKIGLNVRYTINLNLPATSDIAVFNAIFKSLKDNLLSDDDA